MKFLIILLFSYGIAIGVGHAQDGATDCPDNIVLRFSDVEPILSQRCSGCHANGPSGSVYWSDYKTVLAMKDEIYLRVVTLRNMPMYTKMPESERNKIKLWIEQGAQE